MVFSSIFFLLVFLPVCITAYSLSPRKAKNLCILLFSIFFYSWGAPQFIAVILATSTLDYYMVAAMHASSSTPRRRAWLMASVGINLALLFWFKYAGFFVENINALLLAFGGTAWPPLKTLLPIGISFYTFESITYAVDVYRKEHAPSNKLLDYQTYILLFPKLIAGPIVRFRDIADQLQDRASRENSLERMSGLLVFITGLSKKVLLANPLGAFADPFFNHPENLAQGATAWFALLAYTLQLYFDFSGYSDMAIGLARMMGFQLPENFRFPYISRSITEFWRRWHITLGSWMKYYLYIPLGGNRSSAAGVYRNLFIVFLASGLWHGASWNFIIWGAWHGLMLVVERATIRTHFKRFTGLYTFIWVMLGWVWFRTENLHQAALFFEKLQSLNGFLAVPHPRILITLFAGLAFACLPAFGSVERFIDRWYTDILSTKSAFLAYFLGLILLLTCLSELASVGFNPFIYFRF